MSEKNGQISPSATVRVSRGAGNRQHRALVLQQGRKTRILTPVWESSGEECQLMDRLLAGSQYKSDQETADLYHFRQRYSEKIFPILAEKLHLNKETSIVDLCCGTGRVSRSLANFVGDIVGFDFSEHMLSFTSDIPHSRFLIHDISKSPFYYNKVFDHFFIGTALHWIPTTMLRQTIQKSLAKNGSVIILEASWSEENKWRSEIKKLSRTFKEANSRLTYGDKKNKLLRCGLLQQDNIEIIEEVSFTPEYMLKNLTSYSSQARKIKENEEKFSEELFQILSGHVYEGKVFAKLVTRARLYSRPRSFRKIEFLFKMMKSARGYKAH